MYIVNILFFLNSLKKKTKEMIGEEKCLYPPFTARSKAGGLGHSIKYLVKNVFSYTCSLLFPNTATRKVG